MTPQYIKVPVHLYDYIVDEMSPSSRLLTAIGSFYWYGIKISIDENLKTKEEAKLVAFQILSDGNFRLSFRSLAKRFLYGRS